METAKADFFAQDARQVAVGLLGQLLVHDDHAAGCRIAGKIVETEAYCATGAEDVACHGSKNNGRPTSRTAVMFGPAGVAYVYLNYGLHWLFNIVTGRPDHPSAVLIRALEPVDGVDVMRHRRHNRPLSQLTNGPAKLSQAMGFNQSTNGENLCAADSVIWIEKQPSLAPDSIASGPRIGLGKSVQEPWLSTPWRYWIINNPHISHHPTNKQTNKQTITPKEQPK